MTSLLNHKFAIGDEVFYLDTKNQCQSFKVVSISFIQYKDETRVYYYGNDLYRSHPEAECFASIDDMKNHIFKPLLDVQ